MIKVNIEITASEDEEINDLCAFTVAVMKTVYYMVKKKTKEL